MTEYSPDVIKPWGGYTILKKSRHIWVKKLFITQQARFSLQSHQHRSEMWIVLSGEIEAQIGNKTNRGEVGQFFYVPRLKKHRITAIKHACIIEIAFGRVLERDIIRYEDDYGRE